MYVAKGALPGSVNVALPACFRAHYQCAFQCADCAVQSLARIADGQLTALKRGVELVERLWLALLPIITIT